MKNKFAKPIVFVLTASLLLCSCQEAPEKNAIVSKNDGSFEQKINQTAPVQTGTSNEFFLEEPVSIKHSENFLSSDGSVEFSMNIDKELTAEVHKVIEVKPHILTEDDAQRVARTLLGDVNFYERRSSSNPQYSKSQYKKMLNRLSAYASQEALTELMGSAGADMYLEYVRDTIAFWNKKYEDALEADPRTPCDWTLKKERLYNDSDVEIGNRSLMDDSDVLYANAEKDGIEYLYSVTIRDGNDYKVSNISLNLTEGLGLVPVDMAIYHSMLCRTEKPMDSQIRTAEDKAQRMLDSMNLGQWKIVGSSVSAEQIDEITEYTISIKVAPVLEDVPAIFGQPMTNILESYAAVLPMTQAGFTFSANGDIIDFYMNSPLDIVEVVNTTVETMSIPDLVDRCKEQLTLSDAEAYGLPESIRKELEDALQEKILCQVSIDDVQYGLGRVNMKGSEDHYYYIPMMIFLGSAEYIGEQSGTVHYSTKVANNISTVLVCINAVDGSLVS